MTKKDFNRRCRKLLNEFALKAKRSEKDARDEFRQKHRLIYVKTYTVPAYFRQVKISKEKPANNAGVILN